MTTQDHTIRMTMTIPRQVWDAWGGVREAQDALTRHGLWPPMPVQHHRWRIDHGSQAYVIDLEVVITVPNKG